MKERRIVVVCALAIATPLACSAVDAGSKLGGQSTAGQGAQGSGGAAVGGGLVIGTGGSEDGANVACNPNVDDDFDKDGYSITDGDCNDCDKNVNPGAIEVKTDAKDPKAVAIDENCNDVIDEPTTSCDASLAFDDKDPMNGARALGVCNEATTGGKDFGVLSAKWTTAGGLPIDPKQVLQFGIQSDFGKNVSVQAGDRMLVLSSGIARLPGQADAATTQTSSALGKLVVDIPPPGFPQKVPGCQPATNIHDSIALQLSLRAPTNATGFQYLFKFYSFEFAEYVCTGFNDQFVALVDPAPQGSISGNVSFDSKNNPVSVNIAFFDSCDPVKNGDFAMFCFFGNCPPKPNPYCPNGPADLVGNGFDNAFDSDLADAGATSWLQTTVPIDSGEEFEIRFAIWDTADLALDSTVLLDGFEWIATPGTKIKTAPPVPK